MHLSSANLYPATGRMLAIVASAHQTPTPEQYDEGACFLSAFSALLFTADGSHSSRKSRLPRCRVAAVRCESSCPTACERSRSCKSRELAIKFHSIVFYFNSESLLISRCSVVDHGWKVKLQIAISENQYMMGLSETRVHVPRLRTNRENQVSLCRLPAQFSCI